MFIGRQHTNKKVWHFLLVIKGNLDRIFHHFRYDQFFYGHMDILSTLAKPHQDPGDVVGFSTAAGESQRFGGSGGVSTYQRLGDGT